MAEPFKNLFNKTVVEGMASHFKRLWPNFNQEEFVTTSIKDLDSLELKERSEQITNTMIEFLPSSFEQAGELILASLGPPLKDDLSEGTIDHQGIAGWAIMPLVNYVGLQGHDHFDLSMRLLKEMTKRFTSEFGIRFFLLRSPKRTLSVLKTWASDSDQHVRRLASEGSRPRLPWAMRLPVYIKDPSPVIDLLEGLKDDNKEYVRRSVANSLNDISKDHPEVVAEVAAQWMKKASTQRKRLIRHACRTLIKSGHKKTLHVLGYNLPLLRSANISISTPEVLFGEALQFTLSIASDSAHDQPLMIDYILHHQKANGKTSPKVFKWKTTTLLAQKNVTMTNKHPIKKITTRVYYPGLHAVEIMVNGVSIGKVDFQLLIP